jgi:hypothetical protein
LKLISLTSSTELLSFRNVSVVEFDRLEHFYRASLLNLNIRHVLRQEIYIINFILHIIYTWKYVSSVTVHTLRIAVGLCYV